MFSEISSETTFFILRKSVFCMLDMLFWANSACCVIVGKVGGILLSSA